MKLCAVFFSAVFRYIEEEIALADELIKCVGD